MKRLRIITLRLRYTLPQCNFEIVAHFILISTLALSHLSHSLILAYLTSYYVITHLIWPSWVACIKPWHVFSNSAINCFSWSNFFPRSSFWQVQWHMIKFLLACCCLLLQIKLIHRNDSTCFCFLPNLSFRWTGRYVHSYRFANQNFYWNTHRVAQFHVFHFHLR